MPDIPIWGSAVVWLEEFRQEIAAAYARRIVPVVRLVAAARRRGAAFRARHRWRIRLAAILSLVAIPGAALSGFAALLVYAYFAIDLPDHTHLAIYEPPAATQVDAAGGERLAEFATEKRVFVPIEYIPTGAIEAFLAAEDKNFFAHSGIDGWAMTRALIQNLVTLGENRRPVGASTITQQVAKRFFLTNEVSLARKMKEMILAFRLERDFSKPKILELYLNDIYLGRGAYGLVSAAQTYFRKPLDALSLPEFAYLAALPKAPNNYDPARFPDAARARRDWVIGQMARAGYIDDAAAAAAMDAPLEVTPSTGPDYATAGYFTEEVRRDLIARFGETALYTGGLTVHTTLDTELQAAAERALRDGLIAYDRRHGWRGRLGTIDLGANPGAAAWTARLAAFPRPLGSGQWQLAVVLGVDDAGATIGLGQGTIGQILRDELKWARPWLKDQKVGPVPRRASEVLSRGDVVLVEPIDAGSDKTHSAGAFGLRQIPDVSGAIVALDPHTGAVLAMSGGYQFQRNRDEFNRAVQARRQPGSAFKPFVYLTALNNGYTPSTPVSDAPISIGQGRGGATWTPGNYDGTSLGIRPMRVGLEQSRNTMTVRIAERLGIRKIADTAERFGIVDGMPADLSMALGSAETTLLRLTTAYAQLANGGTRIAPSLIDWVRDRHGNLVYDRSTVELPDADQPLDDPRSIYQLVTILRGVIDRGTGTRARVLGKGVYGKTGTTNDEKDAWFIGFTTDIVCGVYVGFDQPRSLGPKEQGASVALPVFVDFMKEALKQLPAEPFPVPRGIVMARVRDSDGSLTDNGEGAVVQAFKTGTVPARTDPAVSDALPREGNPGRGAAAAEFGGRGRFQ